MARKKKESQPEELREEKLLEEAKVEAKEDRSLKMEEDLQKHPKFQKFKGEK